jgi:hypothetical protein
MATECEKKCSDPRLGMRASAECLLECLNGDTTHACLMKCQTLRIGSDEQIACIRACKENAQQPAQDCAKMCSRYTTPGSEEYLTCVRACGTKIDIDGPVDPSKVDPDKEEESNVGLWVIGGLAVVGIGILLLGNKK